MTDTITIVGVVGTEPEQRNHNGTPITTFRVASPQRRFDRETGAWTETGTNWYTVSAYRRLAEHALASIRKRDRVILTGRLRVRNWEAGEKRGTSVDIDLDGLGHDLLFGTTTFTQDERSAATRPASQPGEDGWAPSLAEEGWAAPGVSEADTAPAPESEVRVGEQADRAAVLTGADQPF